jgi:hypothetical protein
MLIKINGQKLQGMLIVQLNYPGVGVAVDKEGKLDYAAASVTIRAHGNGCIREPFEIGIVQLLVSYVRVEQYDGFSIQARRAKSEGALYDCKKSQDRPWYSKRTHGCFGHDPDGIVANRSIRFDFEMTDDPGGLVGLRGKRKLTKLWQSRKLTKLWESADFVVLLLAKHNQQDYVVDKQRWNYRFVCTTDETAKKAEINWSRSWMSTAPLFEQLPLIDDLGRIANEVVRPWKVRSGEFEGW